MRLFTFFLLLALAAPLSAQPARILDINPNGPDGVVFTGNNSTYTPETVNLASYERFELPVWRGEVYFYADDGVHGKELWKTDGTAAGTVMVTDLAPGAESSFVSPPVLYNEFLYFGAQAGSAAPRFMYRYDGTEVERAATDGLAPVGDAGGGLILAGPDGPYVLGSCDEDGGGVICAYERFADDGGTPISGDLLIVDGLFEVSNAMWTTDLTPSTTRELFFNRRVGGAGGTENVIGGVGRPWQIGDTYLFTCAFYADRNTEPLGEEMCTSQGAPDDVQLMEDFTPGEGSSGIKVIGVYDGRLYAALRNPAAPAEFLLHSTTGGSWSQVSPSADENQNVQIPQAVQFMTLGSETAYLSQRQRPDGSSTPVEWAIFSAGGTRLTPDGTEWRAARAAGTGGGGVFATKFGVRGSDPAVLRRWEGGSTVTEIGALPNLPSSIQVLGGTTVTARGGEQRVVMAINGELWASALTSTDAESAPETAFEIESIAPNPASGVASVRVILAAPEAVRVAVYDALGREVAALHDGPLAAGTQALALDTGSLAPGVYVVRLSAGGRTVTRRMMVMR